MTAFVLQRPIFTSKQQLMSHISQSHTQLDDHVNSDSHHHMISYDIWHFILIICSKTAVMWNVMEGR